MAIRSDFDDARRRPILVLRQALRCFRLGALVKDLARSETCFRAACSLHRNVRKSIQATALVIAEPSRHHRGMPLKILVSCVLTLAAAVAVLRSDWVPWRIVSRTELQAHDAAITAAAKATAARVQPPRSKPAVGVATIPLPTPSHAGEWMRDPNYRSALEKTTVAGGPEKGKSRESSRTESTPRP